MEGVGVEYEDGERVHANDVCRCCNVSRTHPAWVGGW